MTLYDQFIEYIKGNHLDVNDFYHKSENGYDIVSFGEKAPDDAGLIYNIVFVFYNESDVAELYIRKHINIDDKLSIYELLNEYNKKYMGTTFFLDENMVSVKSYCVTTGDIKIALSMLKKNMIMTQTLFKNFSVSA